MEEGKGKMYTTGWTTRSLNPLSPQMTSKYARLGISLSVFFFLPFTVVPRDIHVSITGQVVVIARVRPETKLSCLARRTLALVALPRMRRLAVSTWKVN